MRVLLGLVLLLASAANAAEPPAGSPPGIAPAVAMTDRPAEARALDASRKPYDVLTFLGLKRGDRVLDVMTGSGYYAEIIGNSIGSYGTVLAVEPTVFADAASRTALAQLVKRVPNVALVEVMPADLDPPADAYDFVMMHLVYHDLYWSSAKFKFPRMDPDAFLRRLFKAVRPGGIVGVVDHAAAPGGDTRTIADALHRIDPAVVKADFARAGFKLEAESDLLANSADDRSRSVFDAAMKGKTDRMVMRFRKPA